MLIEHDNGLFLARCTYDERLAFKDSGWRWNQDRRAWCTDDIAKARDFQAFATDDTVAAIERVANLKLSVLDLSAAIELPFDFDVPAPLGCIYDPPQKVAIYYAEQHKDTLIADPPGLGKTMCAIGFANLHPEWRRILIVPPAHLKKNWAREWLKWDVKGLSVGFAQSKTRAVRKTDPVILNPKTGLPKKTLTEYGWPDTDVVICAYDSLPDFEAQLRVKVWDLAIFDEAHYLITEGTVRTRHTLGGGRQRKKRKDSNGKLRITKNDAVAPIPALRRLFLTGTPIMSRPLDMWPLCKSIDPAGLGKNWITYTRRYCDGQESFGRYDVSGASHLDELQAKLRLSFMVRRDKTLAMKFLPPKRRQLIELPAEGLLKLVDREVSAMYRVREALAAFESTLSTPMCSEERMEWTTLADVLERRFGHLASLDYVERAKHLTPPEKIAFQELSTARKELSAAKVPMVLEHIRNLLSSGEKVIVFIVHTEMGDALRAEFPGCAYITGKVPMHRRQDEVDRFQSDDTCRLMVGNFIAAGTGYTMTASRLVVCAELEWVWALVEQAEDRAWRRGQLNAVLAQHLAVEGSADARLIEVLLQKQSINHEALDFSALGDLSQRKDLLFIPK